MHRKLLSFCAAMSIWKVLGYGLILAAVFEVLTMLSRFGFDLQATRDTRILADCTCGVRIHHGYVGLLLVPLAWCFPRGMRHALWIVAIGLICSDLAHHFLVLWPLTGSPQFDLIYPNHPFGSKPK